MESNLRATGLFFVLRYFNLMLSFGKSWLVLGAIGVFSDFYSDIVYFNRFAPFLLLGTEIVAFRDLSRSNQSWDSKEAAQVILAGLMVFLLATVFVPIWSLLYVSCSAIIRLVFNKLRLVQRQNLVALIEIVINVVYLTVIALQDPIWLKLIILINLSSLVIWLYRSVDHISLDLRFLKNTINMSLEGMILIVSSSFSTLLLIVLLSLISINVDTSIWNQYNFGLSIANGLTLLFGSAIWYYQKELFELERSKLLAITLIILLIILLLSYLLNLILIWIDPIIVRKDLSYVSFWIFIIALLIPSSVYQSYLVSNKNYFALLTVMILSLSSTLLSFYDFLPVKSSGILACCVYTFGLGVAEKLIHKFK
jgi:hypothetical protein